MYTVKYSPVAAAATNEYLEASEESRKSQRQDAIAAENPFTEEEYASLELEGLGRPERTMRVGYQNIRASRDTVALTGIKSPIGMTAHWFLEVMCLG
jgi:hypothetical protein